MPECWRRWVVQVDAVFDVSKLALPKGKRALDEIQSRHTRIPEVFDGVLSYAREAYFNLQKTLQGKDKEYNDHLYYILSPIKLAIKGWFTHLASYCMGKKRRSRAKIYQLEQTKTLGIDTNTQEQRPDGISIMETFIFRGTNCPAEGGSPCSNAS